MLKIDSERPEPSLIRYAADQIRAGQVLGMPTDTFTGWPPIPSICALSTGCMKSKLAPGTSRSHC
jgi:hypothetical protein